MAGIWVGPVHPTVRASSQIFLISGFKAVLFPKISTVQVAQGQAASEDLLNFLTGPSAFLPHQKTSSTKKLAMSIMQIKTSIVQFDQSSVIKSINFLYATIFFKIISVLYDRLLQLNFLHLLCRIKIQRTLDLSQIQIKTIIKTNPAQQMSIQPTIHPIHQYKHNQHPAHLHHQLILNNQQPRPVHAENEMRNAGTSTDNNTTTTTTMRNRNSKLWLMEAMIEDKDNKRVPADGYNGVVNQQLMSARIKDGKQNSAKNININTNSNSRKSKINTYPDFGIIDRLLKISPFEQDNSQYRHERLSNRLSADLQHQEQPEQEAANQQHKPNQNSHMKQQQQQQQPEYQQNIEHNQFTKEPQHEYYHQNEQQPEQQPQYEHNQDNKTLQQPEQDTLQMLIQLDSQTSIPLKIPPHSNPQRLAQQFCFTNNIDPSVITLLAKQIKQLQEKTSTNKLKYISNNNNNNKSRNINQNSRSHSNINSKYHSIGNSRVHSRNNNNNTFNNSQHSQASITNQDKQNKQHLSNTNGHHQYPHQPFVESNLQLFNPNDPINDYTDTNRYSKYQACTKYNSKNNTGVITNISNNNNHHTYNSTGQYPDVFDRLYKHSENKNKKQQQLRQKQKILQSQQQLRNYHAKDTDNLNQSTMINNLSVSNINYQNTSHNNVSVNKGGIIQLKIYDKNTKLQKQAENRHLNIKQQLQEISNVQCTNQPVINPLSRLIVEKLREAGDNRYVDGDTQGLDLRKSHVRLYRYKDLSKEKNLTRAIQYQKMKEEVQMKECTFHPKILNKSKLQALNTSRYVLLHEDFYIRESKAQSVKASQSKKIFERHHPQINQLSKKLVKDRSFTERMVDYQTKARKSREKIQKQRQSVEKYRPQINKNSKNNKKENISIGEYLYQKSLQKRKSEFAQNSKKGKTHNVNRSSQKMYQQIKKNAFRYIFTLMDSDQDGLISGLKINILGLETEVLQLLAPLLCQMEQVKIELDEEEFVDSLERLFKTFSIYEKNLILNVYKNPQRKSKFNEEPSFHPSLNEKSIEIAREVREPCSSLYDIGRQRQISKQEKMSELRAIKAMIEIQQCTFHPNLFHHH